MTQETKTDAQPRVLVCDEMPEDCLDVLRREGVSVDLRTGLGPEELCECIAGYDVVIVRSSTRLEAAQLEASQRPGGGGLRCAIRAGVGVDNIDVDAATRMGVVVMNVPDANTVSTAEQTWALLLAMARKLPAAVASLKAGRWDRKTYTGVELSGKVLGVVGLGKIGRTVAQRAAGFNMRVVGYDPFITAEMAAKLGVDLAEYEDVLRQADFLTFHVPLNERTRGMLSEEHLALLKDGVQVVNCARGGIVDEAALVLGLQSGKLGGVALDVYEEEPPPSGHPLIADPGVVTTPHLGAATAEARENVGYAAVRQAADFLKRGSVTNAVNTVSLDPKVAERMAPYRLLVERMGAMHAQLMDGRPREVRISYHGDAFDEPARRHLNLAFLQGLLSTWLSGPVNHVNAAHLARENGLELAEKTAVAGELAFSSLIGATLITDQGRRSLSGTIFGQRGPRIVQIDDYTTEAIPEGHMLLVSNDDTPGIMGKVGTALGKGGVNIANMSMGRDVAGGRALALLNLDNPVPDEVQQEIESQPGVLWVRTVKLIAGRGAPEPLPPRALS